MRAETSHVLYFRAIFPWGEIPPQYPSLWLTQLVHTSMRHMAHIPWHAKLLCAGCSCVSHEFPIWCVSVHEGTPPYWHRSPSIRAQTEIHQDCPEAGHFHAASNSNSSLTRDCQLSSIIRFVTVPSVTAISQNAERHTLYLIFFQS